MDVSGVKGQSRRRKLPPSLFSPDVWSLRGKKRKQASRDADSLSLCSLDINLRSVSTGVHLDSLKAQLFVDSASPGSDPDPQLLLDSTGDGMLCYVGSVHSATLYHSASVLFAGPDRVLGCGESSMVVGQSPLCLLVQHFKSGCSVEFSKGNSNMGKQVEEPSTKRSKPVSRVTSLASLLPPVKTAPLKRIGQTLQRSISFRNDSRTERAAPPPPPPSSSTMKTRTISATVSNPSSSMTATRGSAATAQAAKRRDSKLWSETFDVRLGATQPLSPKEIKRQEAIFELAQGEQDLVEDLKLAKKAYHDPMLKLSIMTEQELNQIFGTLDSLIPLHEDLLSHLRDARKPDGSTEHVGHILTDWLPCLSSYTPYCSNQVKAKALLDQKKQDRRVQDFLQRCLQSPFSRKLDLWNFLDIPRSRLVKYPLLLREILKHTANDHPDRQHLDEAMLMVQSVVADINRRTGESECQYYKDRLLYTEDGQRDELIDQSRTLSCHGELKNNRGLKLHVFLFQDVLVITRSVSANDQPVCYQLCRQPIPIRQLDLEDLSDGEMRVGGSIRGAFSNNERTKNFFRVSHRTGAQLQNHFFQASDAFNKQQWINCIRQAKDAAALIGDLPPQTEPCLDKEPGGQKVTLDGTALSLRSDSGIEDEKGMWGEMETGLCLGEKEGLVEGQGLYLGKEAEVELITETMTGRGVETGSLVDGQTGMDSETSLMMSETETGDRETVQGLSDEVEAEGGGCDGGRAEWSKQEEEEEEVCIDTNEGDSMEEEEEEEELNLSNVQFISSREVSEKKTRSQETWRGLCVGWSSCAVTASSEGNGGVIPGLNHRDGVTVRTRGAGPLRNPTMDDILARRVSARPRRVSSSAAVAAGAAELGANVSPQDGEVIEIIQPPIETLAGLERVGAAGGWMERRNSASQLVHQRHMPMEPKKFHIPRKTKEKRAPLQHVSTESREFEDMMTILTSSYMDAGSAGCFIYSKPLLVHSELLEKEFVEKRKEMKADGRTDKELEESYCFLLADADKAPVLCEKGLYVGQSWIRVLGNPSKGVYLSRYSDLLQMNSFTAGATGEVVIFKVMKGKVKSIYENIKTLPDPTPRFDSHISKNANKVTSLTSYRAFELTQQYFYEYSFDELRQRPRQVCPYAVVSFHFKGKDSQLPNKPLAPIRLNSQSAEGTKERAQFTVWSGDLVKDDQVLFHISLRSSSPPLLPHRLPEKLKIGCLLRLEQVTKLLPSHLFCYNLYTSSQEGEVRLMVHNDHIPPEEFHCCKERFLLQSSGSGRQKSVNNQRHQTTAGAGDKRIVLVTPLTERGFLFLLSSAQMATPTERGENWSRCLQALFVFPETRDVAKSTLRLSPSPHESGATVMPRLNQFIPALHHALVKARANPPAELSAGVERQAQEYLSSLNDGKVRQYPMGDYDPKLDEQAKPFPVPKHHQVNMDGYLRSYLYNPAFYLLSLARAGQVIEVYAGPEDPQVRARKSYGDQREPSGKQLLGNTRDENSVTSDIKIQQLIDLVLISKRRAENEVKREDGGEGGLTAPGRKRKLEQATAERTLKYLRATQGSGSHNKVPVEGSRVAASPSSLTSVIDSVGLGDVDLREDGSEVAAKLLKLLTGLTQAASGMAGHSLGELQEEDQKESWPFDRLATKLGLPTNCDIDLRRQEELEDQTAGSISSLEGFSPGSHSGEMNHHGAAGRGGGGGAGMGRTAGGYGEDAVEGMIPWVLIPITAIHSQRQKHPPGSSLPAPHHGNKHHRNNQTPRKSPTLSPEPSPPPSPFNCPSPEPSPPLPPSQCPSPDPSPPLSSSQCPSPEPSPPPSPSQCPSPEPSPDTSPTHCPSPQPSPPPSPSQCPSPQPSPPPSPSQHPSLEPNEHYPLHKGHSGANEERLPPTASREFAVNLKASEDESIHYSFPQCSFSASTEPQRTLPHSSICQFSQYVSFYNPCPPIQDYVSSLQESMNSMITEFSEGWTSRDTATSRTDTDTSLASTVSAFVASIRAANTKTDKDGKVPTPCGDLTAADGSASVSRTIVLPRGEEAWGPDAISRQFPDAADSRTPPASHVTLSVPTSASGSVHKTDSTIVLHPPSGNSPHQQSYTLETNRTIGHTVRQTQDNSITRTIYCATDVEGGSSLPGSNSDLTLPGFSQVSEPFAEPSHPSELVSGSASQSVPAPPATALSSLISQLQPEVFNSLVEIIKDVKKNSLKFYLHSTEPGDQVYDDIKSPVAFLNQEKPDNRLLVIIKNKDIAAHIHEIPSLVALKRHPSVVFVGVDTLDDIRNNSYIELFVSGGCIVSDDSILSPDFISHARLAVLLKFLEQHSSLESVWKWKVHCKTHKKLKEQARFRRDAANILDLLSNYQKKQIVEFLPYHHCDMMNCQSPDQDCLIELQARYTQYRHTVFLTEHRFDTFPAYSSGGIIMAGIEEILHNFNRLVGYHDIKDKQPIMNDLLATKGLSGQLNITTSVSGPDQSPSIFPKYIHHVSSSDQPQRLLQQSRSGLLPLPHLSDQLVPDGSCKDGTSLASEADLEVLRLAISQFRAERQAKLQQEQQLDSQAKLNINPTRSFLPSCAEGDHTTPPPVSEKGPTESVLTGRQAVADTLALIHSRLQPELEEEEEERRKDRRDPPTEEERRGTNQGGLLGGSCGLSNSDTSTSASNQSTAAAMGPSDQRDSTCVGRENTDQPALRKAASSCPIEGNRSRDAQSGQEQPVRGEGAAPGISTASGAKVTGSVTMVTAKENNPNPAPPLQQQPQQHAPSRLLSAPPHNLQQQRGSGLLQPHFLPRHPGQHLSTGHLLRPLASLGRARSLLGPTPLWPGGLGPSRSPAFVWGTGPSLLGGTTTLQVRAAEGDREVATTGCRDQFSFTRSAHSSQVEHHNYDQWEMRPPWNHEGFSPNWSSSSVNVWKHLRIFYTVPSKGPNANRSRPQLAARGGGGGLGVRGWEETLSSEVEEELLTGRKFQWVQVEDFICSDIGNELQSRRRKRAEVCGVGPLCLIAGGERPLEEETTTQRQRSQLTTAGTTSPWFCRRGVWVSDGGASVLDWQVLSCKARSSACRLSRLSCLFLCRAAGYRSEAGTNRRLGLQEQQGAVVRRLPLCVPLRSPLVPPAPVCPGKRFIWVRSSSCSSSWHTDVLLPSSHCSAPAVRRSSRRSGRWLVLRRDVILFEWESSATLLSSSSSSSLLLAFSRSFCCRRSSIWASIARWKMIQEMGTLLGYPLVVSTLARPTLSAPQLLVASH
ncbi:hypothetical protein INR49_001838, partial [Caranx melampygus]